MAKSEAQGLIRSLEAARPNLNRWLQIKRTSPLPVIVSARTANASFANFLTDAIELQTMGQGGRDLAWHELVHSSMYRHLDNVLGPAGSIIHLPWMPAWWIEGLAEALSLSIGGAEQTAIERYYALSNKWPSYAKLHSLYGGGPFSHVGYGISGGFVSYLLKTYDAAKLPKLLNDFYHYSMPWWWPMTIVPFTNYMPMDRVLTQWTGKTGEDLYEEYKSRAKFHWSSQQRFSQSLFSSDFAALFWSPNPYELRNESGKIYKLVRQNLQNFETEILPEKSSPISKIPLTKLDMHFARARNQQGIAFLTSQIDDDRNEITSIHYAPSANQVSKIIAKRRSDVRNLTLTKDKVFWFETIGDLAQYCFQNIQNSLKKPKCFLGTRQPHSLVYLGQRLDASGPISVFKIQSETLKGDRSKIVLFHLSLLTSETHLLNDGGIPIATSSVMGKQYFLLQDHFNFRVRELDANFVCQNDWLLPLAARSLVNVGQKLYAIIQIPENGYRFLPVPIEKHLGGCSPLTPGRSPLLFSQIKPNASLKESMAYADIWGKNSDEQAIKAMAEINEAPDTGKVETVFLDATESKEAKWRGRSLFIFPWIGADGEGNSFGFRSVPLMDQMQNETVQFAALYGAQSKFPDIGLSLESSRFKTQIATNIYNRQTFNGVFNNSLMYYKETGGSVEMSRFFPTLDLHVNYGLSSGYFNPVIGPPEFKFAGTENKFDLALSRNFSFDWFVFSQSLFFNIVPESVNKTWEYNQLGESSTISIPIQAFSRQSNLSLGLSASGTRGTKRKFLKEVYRPLKTYVPGDGGGINGTNFNLIGLGLLTSAVYGDTQARAKVAYTIPLIPNFEKLIGIFYLDRVDFSTFVNYGTAWTGDFDANNLVLAHGYNLDLATDIKGVSVNFGLGVGQVVGNNFEMYFKFGFDTLIDIEGS